MTERAGEAGPAEERVAQFEALLSAISESIWVFDAAGNVAYINEATARQLGLEPTPEVLENLRRQVGEIEVYRPDGSPVPPEQGHVARVLRGETVTGEEMLYRLPGGPLRWVLLSAAPIRDRRGRVTGEVLTAADITSQKQTQAELERLLAEAESSRQNRQAILDRLSDSVLVVDQNQRIVLTNAALREQLGHDVVGMSLAEVWRAYGFRAAGGRTFANGQTPVQRAARGEVITGIEAHATLPNGRQYDLQESAVPLRDALGNVTAVVVTMADITARKAAQAERERLLTEVESGRQQLYTIINRLPDGIMVLDREQHITLHNEAIAHYLERDVHGASLADLRREHGFSMPDGQPFPQGQTPIERALRGETVSGAEVRLNLPQGRCNYALESAAPLYEPGNERSPHIRGAVLALTDITAQKELDRAKDEFLSVAAHELRNPLTSLKGHSQMLLRRAAQAGKLPEDMHSLEVIDSQVDHLNELIGRLLDMSRVRLGRLQLQREQVDLVHLAQSVAEEMQVTTDAHRILLDAEAPQLIGRWDPAVIRQVFANLIGNAIKYAPGGEIRIRVRREDGQALASVSDQGPGIPPEQQRRLFEAFTRGSAEEYRRASGLGLGLYVSRGIVEAHGGHIWVESRAGAGATFAFSLPLEAPAE